MPITVGDQAPDFTLYSSEKEQWTLSDHRGEKVLLLFFPGAFSSVCTTELNTVSNDLARYHGATVVGISTDAPGVLAEFSDVNDFQFPLLSDHDAEVAGRYGARFTREEHNLGYSRVAKRASFVVGEDGTVRYAEVLANPGNEPDYDAIVSSLTNS